MALRGLVVTLSMAVASSAMASVQPPQTPAPAGGPDTRYCLRVDPPTGSRIETVQCRTRDEWALLEVNVDEEWAENGVRVLEPGALRG